MLNNKQYRFDFKKERYRFYDTDNLITGLLELFDNNKKLFSLKLSYDYDSWVDIWKPFDIITFLEEDWINDFESLKEAIVLDFKNKAIRDAENPLETEIFKKNFGIY